jgi:hypothetical protein
LHARQVISGNQRAWKERRAAVAERRSLEAPRRSEHEEHEGDAYDDAP